MAKLIKNRGFSTIELLVTLLVAATFLISGYQLYMTILRDSGETIKREKAVAWASRVLNKYKGSYRFYDNTTSDIELKKKCVPAEDAALSDSDSDKLPPDGLPIASIKMSGACPYTEFPNLAKVTVEVKYGSPQKTIRIASYAQRD